MLLLPLDPLNLLGALLLLASVLASVGELWFGVCALLWRGRIEGWRLRALDLNKDRPAHLAVWVPVWQDAGVIGPMIESTLDLMHYPTSQVEIFVAVSPDDAATLPEVQALSERHPNVHCVVRAEPGPPPPGHDLGGLYGALSAHEQAAGRKFEMVAVQSPADLIHPYTFRLHSVLLKKWKAVQLPIFALLPGVKWRWASLLSIASQLWSQTVTASLADALAERWRYHLPAREALGLPVPCLRSGFALRRAVLESLALDSAPGLAVLSGEGLALRLWQQGVRVHFHVQPLPRLDARGRSQPDDISIRTVVASTVSAAIEEQGRWTSGSGRPAHPLRLSLLSRWAMWHDRQRGPAALLTLTALILAAGVLLLSRGAVTSITVISLLAWAVLGLCALRVLVRAAAARHLYGWGQALVSALVLPGLPLRWLLSLMTLAATLGAGSTRRTPQPERQGERSKVQRRKSYMSAEVLAAARRRLGDQLLFSGEVSPHDLARLLQSQKTTQIRMGELALGGRLVSESRLTQTLADTQGLTFLELTPEMLDRKIYSAALARDQHMAVLGLRGHRLIIATPYATDHKRLSALVKSVRQVYGLSEVEVVALATSQASLERAYSRPGLSGSAYQRLIRDESIELDMLPHALQELRRTYETAYGGKFYQPRARRGKESKEKDGKDKGAATPKVKAKSKPDADPLAGTKGETKAAPPLQGRPLRGVVTVPVESPRPAKQVRETRLPTLVSE
ncbi:glycosyltransferase [Deinococcus sp.]|uniref:glycosyltransferase n=1 Tax=Deinococcus sp. TaxID=47478 RepID=UPI003CC5520F